MSDEALINFILGAAFVAIIIAIWYSYRGSLIARHFNKERNERDWEALKLIAQTTAYLDKINGLLDSNDFIDREQIEPLRREGSIVLISLSKIDKFRFTKYHSKLSNLKSDLDIALANLSDDIDDHNDEVATSLIPSAVKLIGKVEGQNLDGQQLKAIVKRMHNHLVLAGAGTGKTTTIVGKIKYLLASGAYSPNEILVLSFTNASAVEMSSRIKSEVNADLKTCTFHKLGLDIITSVEGKKPNISNISIRQFALDFFKENSHSSSYLTKLNNYLLYGGRSKSEFDFKSLAEYQTFIAQYAPATIDGKHVKSYGELDITNFLIQNKIKYEYERPYPVDTRNSEYGQYRPDFYLPDYDIYIEYFGINRTGNVPSYFTSKNGLSATENYRRSMEWKRKLHNDSKTTLIECFAYERNDDTLLKNLASKLIANGVELSPMSADELWQYLNKQLKNPLYGLAELVETVINLIKNNNYTIADVRRLSSSSKYSRNDSYFIDLLEPIYAAYQQKLDSSNTIDFNDMINLAAKYVADRKFINPYKYVVIDEYQDISQGRYNLLKALRTSSDYPVFCVGDDWQSIYRFTGSNINCIIDFEKFWGAAELSKIETTYRFNQSLIDVSSRFIMRNPAQLKKKLRSYTYDNKFAFGTITSSTSQGVIERLCEELNKLPRESSVFLLGRYSFDSKMLEDCDDLKINYSFANNSTNITYTKRPDLTIKFMTAHRSKGLQADYAFIINTGADRLGFPSEIQDSPVIDLLLAKNDDYPYAEERRLFYVAMTRARIKTYFVINPCNKSTFIHELEPIYSIDDKEIHFTCPICGGALVKKTGKYGEFIGCANYSKTGCRYTRQHW